ncbi:hypothetical protein SmJEL517_g04647 [Synchytrium microbalum]|uniref:Transcription initiation factor TFIID subunit 13 n=1 Tax=Synchytrium microbalum TaxID=1806994 RepID=A0A507C290_9FUNG|nr:uncharacterized protein SmJEL517_g04647 [Synchytrium microbalum]TPX32204.1 hypothetical protein SmJEL517_g04647 [Synchytrium microbalum]
MNKRKRVFTESVREVMYAYGDTNPPASDTVELMEDLLLEYFYDYVCFSSHSVFLREVKKCSGARKTKLVDFLFPLRRDPPKLARAKELIVKDKEIRKARQIAGGEIDDLQKLAKAKNQ